jgi:energy-coupling factor transport system ATP-binding protein
MIEIRDLTFNYSAKANPVLLRINAVVQPASITLVCGATGSGKSTLLKTLNGLAPNFSGGEISGSILIDSAEVIGQKPHQLAQLVGYVGQNPEHTFVADSVEAELAFGMQQLGFEPNEMRRRIDDICAALKLTPLMHQNPAELSGGEQQRVAIAAALVAGQKVLLLDEPTSALDPDSASKVLELLSQLTRERNLTVVVAEHRIEWLAHFAYQAVVLFDDGTAKVQTCDEALETLKGVAAGRMPFSPSGNLTSTDEDLKPGSEHQFEHLSLSYGTRVALHPTNLQLEPSSVTGLIGPNGSGKTSLLWAIWQQAKQDGKPAALVPQKAADLLFLGSLADELQESDRQSSSNAVG